MIIIVLIIIPAWPLTFLDAVSILVCCILRCFKAKQHQRKRSFADKKKQCLFSEHGDGFLAGFQNAAIIWPRLDYILFPPQTNHNEIIYRRAVHTFALAQDLRPFNDRRNLKKKRH